MCGPFSPKLVILICLCLAGAASAASADDPFTEGDRLAAEGLADEAVTAYLRAVYSGPGSTARSALYARIAAGCAELGDFNKAVRYGNEAIRTASTDSERRERIFFRLEILLAGRRYRAADKDLAALESLPLAPPHRLRVRFLRGILALYLRDWEAAYAHLSLYFAESDTYSPPTEIRALKLLAFARRMWKPDPSAARALSLVVPGLGQVYSGAVPQGFNSLAVAGGAGTLMVLAAAAGDWPDALAVGWFFFLRYYLGSPYHAARLSLEKNDQRDQAIQSALLRLLIR